MPNPKVPRPKSPPTPRAVAEEPAQALAAEPAKPVDARVGFVTLASLRASLGPADESVRRELFDAVPEEALVAEGRRVASPTLVSGVVSYVVEVQHVLASLSPEQNAQLVGFDASFLPLLADETARLDGLSTRAVNEGIVVDVATADRKAQAEAASARGVALRDQGARAMRRVLLGQESDLAALEQAVGNASTAASLASGLEFVAGQIEHQRAHGDADRRSLLARVKLTAAYAAVLSAAAKDVVTTAEAASAVAQKGVTQRALDLQDGRVMRIVDWVNRAFRDANAVNGAIAVPKLGDLEALFVNTRRAAAKADPDPTPPKG